jgi:hypothetical protein
MLSPVDVAVALLVVVALGASFALVMSKYAAFLLLVVLLFFSNLLLASIGRAALDHQSMRVLQGGDFLFACLVLGVFLVNHKVYCSVQERRLLWLVLGLCGVYFAYGAVRNGGVDASIYLRVILYAPMLYFIGLYFGRYLSVARLQRAVLFIGIVSAFIMFFEFLAPRAYYALVDAADYYHLKTTRPLQTPEDVVKFRTRVLLNLRVFGDLKVLRPGGLTFHYPSAGYILAFSTLVAMALRRHALAVLFVSAIIVSGGKGPMIAVMNLGAAALVFRLGVRLSWGWMAPLSVLYVGGVLGYMLYFPSIHAFSLLSTVLNLSDNPLGGGLGFGGSMTSDIEYDWSFNMLYGDNGLAVLLNMMGILGLSLYAFYVYGTSRLLDRREPLSYFLDRRSQVLWTVYGVTLIANTVIQEIAIGPYALGLYLMGVAWMVSASRVAAARSIAAAGTADPASPRPTPPTGRRPGPGYRPVPAGPGGLRSLV